VAEVASKTDPSSAGGVKQGVFYGQIDEEEEDEERKSQKQAPLSPNLGATTGGDEVDELMIKEQMRIKNMQHKPMLGLDESDESDDEADKNHAFESNKSSQNRFKRRPTE
jgi:hypothetical protein